MLKYLIIESKETLQAFHTAIDKVVATENIRASFRYMDLIPNDLNWVLSKLNVTLYLPKLAPLGDM